jgi:hypothetical protein
MGVPVDNIDRFCRRTVTHAGFAAAQDDIVTARAIA